MPSIPKMLIIAGAVLIVIGLIWAVGGRFFNFGRMPGDIVVERENVKFYFPIVTCLVISVVGSLIIYLIRWFTK